jgi:hypothetical protein
MPITLTLDKETYSPGGEVYVTVQATEVEPVSHEFTITASRVAAGQEETAEVTFTVNYPQQAGPVTVSSPLIDMTPQYAANTWGGRIPSEKPEA